MYLADTNLFLEILLDREKSTLCEEFLQTNAGSIFISDFSLHSIGVILFRLGKEEVFPVFLNDVIPNTKLVSLPTGAYKNLLETKKAHGLDFDDSYQLETARAYGLSIATMDKDFNAVAGRIKVTFL